jgi:spore maturation protein SpmA
MALSKIWFAFFIIAFGAAIVTVFNTHDTTIFKTIVDGMFEAAEMAVMKIALPLAGVMTFFMGLLNIGEKAGATRFLARITAPFFQKLFPEVPANHPANGQMIMNFSSNILGLDNAATPFGLKAMQSLQELNPDKETASNAQIMFMVLHSAGPVLIPLSIMAQRAIYEAKDPSDVFLPCLIATIMATLTALVTTAIKQKINLFDTVLLKWLGGILLSVGLLIFYFINLPKEAIQVQSSFLSNFLLMTIIVAFLVGGYVKKVDLFGSFVEGAKGGFETSVKIIPYLVGMLVAISALRNSGVLSLITDQITNIVAYWGFDSSWTSALPTALMHPLSGGGSRALMIDTMKTYGPDSFAGRLACVFQGSSDTILYVLALYFGSVNIKNTRYTLWVGLLADFVGIVTAIYVSYLFFA